MYKCELVNNEIIQERFFRDGESEEDVLEVLENFQWPDGEWRITDIDDEQYTACNNKGE